MVKLSGMLSRVSPVRVLVIGDFMLDTYTAGKVKRISPEAPVSVLHVQKEESLPGGAGNVALNLISLGAQVIAVGRVGFDLAGEQLRGSLQKDGVDIENLIFQKEYKTPVKNRLIADAQQILRVDFESVSTLPEQTEEEIVSRFPSLIQEVEIIAVSDYAKGFLSPSLLQKLIRMASAKGIPVIVDPKGNDFSKYAGATAIKPNLTEAYAAAKLPLEASLDQVASVILQNCGVEMLIVTRSEAGISLFNREGHCFDFPVRSKEVKDVTGAGDTVLSVISIVLASKLDIKYGVQLANIAAGMAIERVGCARIHFSEIAERLLEFDVENKIFDEEHLFALQQVLKGKRYTVLGIDSKQGMSTALFRSLRKLSSREPQKKLIAYICDNDPDEEFISLLSSLAEVDFIVLKRESLKNLCSIIHPHQVFVMEKEELVALDHATALLSRVRDAVLPVGV
jgi:D-glycero-beta-D-manno-heptose-7-phosphate kinase